jgi:hypothetical protein
MIPFLEHGYIIYRRKRGGHTLLGSDSEEEKKYNMGDENNTINILNDLARGKKHKTIVL